MHGDVEQSALRDQLTGLYTRAYMEAALEQMLALRRRTSGGGPDATVSP